MGAKQYNPGVEEREEGLFHEGERLCKTTGSKQLVFKCTHCHPGNEHYRLVTLDAIRNNLDKLKCCFCQGKASMHSTQAEDIVLIQLKSCCIDQEVAAQVKLSWWDGRMDFYHLPTKIIIQVDGSAHNTTCRGVGVAKAREKDLQCCLAAWEDGAKLVRLHDADKIGCNQLLLGLSGHSDRIPAMVVATAQAQGVAASSITLQIYSKFIVLSQEFRGVHWGVQGEGKGCCFRKVSFTEELLARLEGAAVCIPLLNGAMGYVPIAQVPAQ